MSAQRPPGARVDGGAAARLALLAAKLAPFRARSTSSSTAAAAAAAAAAATAPLPSVGTVTTATAKKRKAPPTVHETSSDDEYDVEAVTDVRLVKGVTQYLYARGLDVKWAGFSVAESTWEPIENLADCANLVHALSDRVPVFQPARVVHVRAATTNQAYASANSGRVSAHRLKHNVMAK